MLSRSDLHPYQTRAVDFIVKSDKAFGVLGLGLGKTVSALTACRDLLDGFMINCVLVIAPMRVGLHVWPNEIEKWRHLSGTSYVVAIGTQKQREKALDAKAEITIINRENVPWLVQRYGKAWPFDMVLIDESQSFKSSSSQRFKALKKIRNMVSRVGLLTATPTPNSLLELWPQVYLLDMGQALGKTFSGFRSAYFESDYMGFNWTLRPGAKERIESAIRPYMLTMRTEDYLTLPEKIEQQIRIELPPKIQALYREMEKEFISEIAGQEITAINSAVLCGKLHQMAQGAIYDEKKGVHHIHDAKLDALEDLIEAAGEPVILVYGFRHDFDRIKARFPEAVDVKESGSVDNWNSGSIPLLCCHPASAGHGLNLQEGGRHMVFFCNPWSGELDEQIIGRIYRQGQKKRVFIHRLVVSGTIDERILDVVREKGMNQREFVKNMIGKG